jgi:glycerophosphoryl diester phosphodiesterase
MAETEPLLQEKLNNTAGLLPLLLVPILHADHGQASFTLAKQGRPQCIAHRGYNAAYPENTMAAFIGAIEAGAHALETDIHLSKDGVVVLSHVRDSAPA